MELSKRYMIKLAKEESGTKESSPGVTVKDEAPGPGLLHRDGSRRRKEGVPSH